MHLQEYEPVSDDMEAKEAQENLRIIRDVMERSTKHSTFSGRSGVLAGLISIAGCLIQQFAILPLPTETRRVAFVCNWLLVVVLAIGTDYLLTKRRAPLVGKTIRSRLGQQMVLAAGPGLGVGGLLTLVLLQAGLMNHVYPVWMLTYGTSVSAVGLFSQKEVQRLGWAFLGFGALTVCIQAIAPAAAGSLGLMMNALAFGGFHIAYGIAVSKRGGW